MVQCTYRLNITRNKQHFLLVDDVAMETGDIMDNDDADWYRQEVGEEPDPGKFFVCHILPPSPDNLLFNSKSLS